MIKNLKLTGFRNYTNENLDINKNIVVLYGNNGSGKTNILEAISVLADGKGFKKATADCLINKHANKKTWSIDITFDEQQITASYEHENKTGKRVYKIDGEIVKNLNEFRKNVHIVWLTYESDRLFLQAPACRRDFIDMLCNVTDAEHITYLKSYEKLIRERMNVLKDNYNEQSEETSKCLDVLEAQICEAGLKVAQNRIKTVRELEEYQLVSAYFPKFANKMIGTLESEVLEVSDENNVLEMYKSALKERRVKDSVSGSTTLGVNRSDWLVNNLDKDIDAAQCSAGEQKILLTGIFLSFITNKIKNNNWIILLDDVTAHLDETYTTILLKYVKDFAKNNHDKINIWLSGASRNIFSALGDQAQYFEIDNGKVSEKGRWL